MKLIADSGSTKTDWRLIDDDGKIRQFKTDGLNPLQQDEATIYTILAEQLPNDLNPEALHFYGAGCSSEKAIERIRFSAKRRFKSLSTIQVHSDVLAAARALCGTEEGIVCILGTGSNACAYDGDNIIANAPSLGYVLNDVGSGSWLGKKLLHDYFGKRLAGETRKSLEGYKDISLKQVFDQVYVSERPAAYLASFSQFILERIHEPYFYNLVYEGFMKFIDENIGYLSKKWPVHFTGSIAFYYANILRKAGSDSGIVVKNIIQSPIAGLTLYHQNS
ncbi:MAG: N-acetylglucosamine kinase [Fulvivirga sp.]|uniref:N-acetylglucosamine kinase n=1 Tax=Fulvivirga sp. TaxID=1931237 RepID=UPI0032F08E48